MTTYQFEAMTRLIRWGENSTSGRTITLEIPPDEGEAHPFRGFPTGHSHGQRFRMCFEPIGDDEQPDPGRPTPESRPPASQTPPVTQGEPAGANPRSRASREQYDADTDMGKARRRAGMLPDNERFQRWVSETTGWNVSKQDAEDYIRAKCRGSRSAIADDPNAYEAYLRVETDFKIWAGQMAAPQ